MWKKTQKACFSSFRTASKIGLTLYFLILDTSTDQCVIALAREDQIIAEEIFAHCNLLSHRLLPSIQVLIEKNIRSPKNLNGIAFGIGPGSYTGTRLGVTVAKSLAFGLQIPIKTFHSPLAFLPNREGTFAFLIPTRSKQVYVLSGSISSSQVIQKEVSLVNEEQLEKFEAVDFLICSSDKDFPPAFRNKTYYPPVPNLHALCHFLSEQEHASLENVELLYLHTPF
jgi:tRNA threonylcarbamoyl adenosine modification protein YeaZ